MSGSIALQRAFEAVQHLDGARPPWQDVLEGFRQVVGGDSASFMMFDAGDRLLQLEQQGVDAQAEREYVEHFHAQDPLMKQLRGVPAGAWLDTAEAFTPDRLSRQAFYVDYMSRHRMRQLVGVVLDNTPQRRASMSVQRSQASGGLRALVERPEARRFTTALQQAVDRLQQRSAQAWFSAEAAFSAFGEALLLATPAGMVLQLSPRAHLWLGGGAALLLRSGRLLHPDPRWQAMLARALREAADGTAPAVLMLPNAQGVVDRLELTRADRPLSLAGEVLVLVRVCRVRGAAAVAPGLLAAAFGLTPAEARVLAALMVGTRPKDLAAAHQVSLSTVRTQIAALMDKMDCARQADLLRKAAAFL